ncbi:MAG: hypothetical protein NTW44_01435 [Nitrospirae bacterium]|nr:hypothetical protein [Nitrospirota bacterium]
MDSCVCRDDSKTILLFYYLMPVRDRLYFYELNGRCVYEEAKR